MLSLLLDAHADCNAVDNDQTTALDFACRNGYHMVVKMLLTKQECGTDSNEQGKVSPLSVAIHRGFFDCAQFLLEKNACAEFQEIGNRTALCQAALNGHVALCQHLLKHGANSNVSFEEKPVLCVVAESGNLEIVTLLVESGAEIDATDSRDQTSLQTASTKGHKALVAYLLDHGANIYHEDIFGRTPIQDAACFGFTEIVQILIDSGADLQRPDLNGWTPLHLCHNLPEIARFLLENGANVNNVQKNGATPLHLAARNNYPEVVKVLLSYNPDLEISSTGRESALSAAALDGPTDVIRLLLEAGADINHRYAKNKNTFPLLVAVEKD